MAPVCAICRTSERVVSVEVPIVVIMRFTPESDEQAVGQSNRRGALSVGDHASGTGPRDRDVEPAFCGGGGRDGEKHAQDRRATRAGDATIPTATPPSATF